MPDTKRSEGPTPGPWRVFEDCDGECTIARERKAGWTHGVVVDGLPYEGEMAKANARLIAAAPDLLEAAREALEQFDVLAKDPANNWWCMELRHNARSRA